MNSDRQAASDLHYVRGVVESSQAFPGSTPSILYLWAAIVLTGFVMMDYDQSWFWAVGGFGGGMLSIWLGRRAAESRGQVDHELALRANLHWIGGLAGGLLLSIPLQITGLIDEATNGRIALLIIAIVYFLAGVHFDRVMVWAGGLAVVAYGSTFFLSDLTWTIPGALIATGLVLAGLRHQIGQ